MRTKKMRKSHKYGGSRRLRGGNRFLNFLGLGKPSVTPEDAQAQQVTQAQADEVAGLQQMTESKQQQALALRNQCQDYQRRADQLDEEAAEHMRATAEIARNRESKNRCDQEHAMRLQAIEQDFQQRLSEITQQHNEALAAENQRAQEEHAACLREGMRLSAGPIADAQQREDDMNRAAAVIQAQRRAQRDRRSADADDFDQFGMVGGRKSRRRGGRKSRRRGRKTRRGGTGCGSHKKKMMYAGRKSRRGGRKSRRGGARCSPKLKKNCPYYKKYGNHM